MKKRYFLLAVALTLLLGAGVLFGLRALIPVIDYEPGRVSKLAAWTHQLYWHDVQMSKNALNLRWESAEQETIREMPVTRTLREKEQIKTVLAQVNAGADAHLEKQDTAQAKLRLQMKPTYDPNPRVQLYQQADGYFLRRIEAAVTTDWKISPQDAEALLAQTQALIADPGDPALWEDAGVTRLAAGVVLWTAPLPAQQYKAVAEAVRAVLDTPSEPLPIDLPQGAGQWCLNVELTDGVFLRMEYTPLQDGTFTLRVEKQNYHAGALNYDNWTADKTFLFRMQDPFAALVPDFEKLVEEVLQ